MTLQAQARIPSLEVSGRARQPRDSVTLLTIFIGALFFLPARFVFIKVGAAGRPALVVGLGALALWTMYLFIPARRAGRGQPMRWAVGFYLLVLGTSYVAALDRGMPGVEARGADRELLLSLSLAGIALAAMDGLPTRATIDRVLLRLNYAAATMAAVGAVQFATGFDATRMIQIPGLVLNRELIIVGTRGSGGVPRVAGTAGHYIEFGVILGMMLPLAIHFARHAVTHRQRQARWASVLLMGLGIPFSVSRAGAVAVAISLVVASIGWTLRFKFNVLATIAIGTVGLRVAKPGLVGTIRALFTNLGNDPSISGRTSDYVIIGGYVADRPWLGRGPGTFIPERYLLLDNQWIGQTVATGYVGTFAFAMLFVTGLALVSGIKHFAADEQSRDLVQSLAAALLTGAITSFFFDSMHFAIFGGVIFLLLGCLGALWQTEQIAATAITETRDGRADALLS